jgi:hypothetical protein
MAAGIYTVVSVLAVGLWTVCSLSEARSLNSIDYDNLAEEEPSPQQMATLERYLRHVRDYLVDDTEDGLEALGEKRGIKPSQFFGMRGKRQFEEEEDVNDDDREHLANLVRYFQYLNSKRTGVPNGMLRKRQPPSGFHAVRGRRSAYKSRQSLPLM